MDILKMKKELVDLRRDMELSERAYLNVRSIKWGRKSWIWQEYAYELDAFAESLWHYIIKEDDFIQ